LIADGTGLVALSYRGYGGSTGLPSEHGVLLDAATAYEFAAARYAPERIVVWGTSLGSGPAVAIAAPRWRAQRAASAATLLSARAGHSP
jgi:fermentation-respiration switch protein FrsA (DUF1100 family)